MSGGASSRRARPHFDWYGNGDVEINQHANVHKDGCPPRPPTATRKLTELTYNPYVPPQVS